MRAIAWTNLSAAIVLVIVGLVAWNQTALRRHPLVDHTWTDNSGTVRSVEVQGLLRAHTHAALAASAEAAAVVVGAGSVLLLRRRAS